MVEPYLPELRKRSAERVLNDKEFSYIREDMELFKKQQADKTFSLNEKVRLKEKEETDARLKAREKERLARPQLAQTTYEISLKQALLPGLPAPDAPTNSTAIARGAKSPALPASGSGTNSPIAAVKEPQTATTTNPGLESVLDEVKPPAIDADLLESEHILVDYISLVPKGNLATAAQTIVH